MCKTGVIIVAGGSGSRMRTETPKQFLKLKGKEILVWSIEKFMDAIEGCQIVVVLPEGEQRRWDELKNRYAVLGQCKTCGGGATRFDSVKRGLKMLDECDLVAVHDAVRPLVSTELIRDAVEVAEQYGAAIPVVEPVDSFRLLTREGAEPVDRNLLRMVQTPQVFDSEWIREAYKSRYSERFTDDASVVEKAGYRLSFCRGERRNMKITVPEDLIVAEALIERSSEETVGGKNANI